MKVQLQQKIAFSVLFFCTLLVVIPVLVILVIISIKGFSAIDLGFLTEMPTSGMTAGGIFPAILIIPAVAVFNAVGSSDKFVS